MADPIKYVIPNKQIVLLRNSSTKKVIGIGIAEVPDANALKTPQVQHWFMLITDLKEESIPKQQARILVPSEAVWDEPTVALHIAWKGIDSIERFLVKSRETGVFDASRNVYIVANCEHYTGMLPDVLTDPSFPVEAEDDGHQAYWGVAPLQKQNQVNVLAGLLFARSDNTDQIVEYWMLGDTYRAPSVDANTDTIVASTNKMTGNDFKNLISGRLWNGTATLAVASCTLYHDMAHVPGAL